MIGALFLLTGEYILLVITSYSIHYTKLYEISENYNPGFSKDGTKLHFGIAPPPLVEDTTLLEEEKVSVEVWNYRDARIYTQQNVLAGEEKKRSYHCIADLSTSYNFV